MAITITKDGGVQFAYSSVIGLATCQLDSTRVAIFYYQDSYLRVIIATVTGGSISYGTSYQMGYFSQSNQKMMICKIDTDKLVCTYRNTDNDTLYSLILTISGSSVTINGPSSITSTGSSANGLCEYDTNKFVILTRTSNIVYVKNYSVSGTTISSIASNSTGATVSSSNRLFSYKLSTNKILIVYRKDNYTVGLRVVDISDSTITTGDETTINIDNSYNTWSFEDSVAVLSSSKFLIPISRQYNVPFIVCCTISGTTITADMTNRYNYSLASGQLRLSKVNDTIAMCVSSTDGKTFSIQCENTTPSVRDASADFITSGYNDSLLTFIKYVSGGNFYIPYSQNTPNSGRVSVGSLPVPSTSNIKSYNTNLYANIKSINTNLISNVKTLNTNP